MTTEAINWRQYRALLKATMLMETRGQAAKRPYRRTISLVLSYAFASLYLAWTLSQSFYEPAYVVISFTVTMFLAAFTVINSYSFIVLDAGDDTVLQQFLVSKKTLFAVRSTNLFFYIFLVSIPFYVPLLIFFSVNSTSPETVFAFFTALFFASIWTTCLFLILYNGIVYFFSNSTEIFSFVQIIFILLLLFFYQSLPSFNAAHIAWEKILTGSFPYYFPPIWFASLFWSLQQFDVIPAQQAALLLGSGTLVMLIFLLRSPLILLPKVRLTPKRASDHPAMRIDPFYSLMSLFRSRNRARRAGYDFLRTMFYRDRMIQMHTLPVLLMPIAVSLYGILSDQFYTPLDGQIFYGSAVMHVTVTMFYLFAARHLILTVAHSRFASARWIFAFCSSEKLGDYTKGVYNGILTNVLLPIVIVLFVLFLATMPFRDAVLQATFLFTLARFHIWTWSVFQQKIPFTMPEDKLSSAGRVLGMFWVLLFMLLVLPFHYLTSSSPYAFGVFLLGMEISSQLMSRYLSRRQYAVDAW